jgi:hypothetical protein
LVPDIQQISPAALQRVKLRTTRKIVARDPN